MNEVPAKLQESWGAITADLALKWPLYRLFATSKRWSHTLEIISDMDKAKSAARPFSEMSKSNSY